jgi:hypothetical protein
MLDLNLLKKSNEMKAGINVLIYHSVHKRLMAICKAEGVQLSHLIRHLVNKFLSEYVPTNTVVPPDPVPLAETVPCEHDCMGGACCVKCGSVI